MHKEFLVLDLYRVVLDGCTVPLEMSFSPCTQLCIVSTRHAVRKALSGSLVFLLFPARLSRFSSGVSLPHCCLLWHGRLRFCRCAAELVSGCRVALSFISMICSHTHSPRLSLFIFLYTRSLPRSCSHSHSLAHSPSDTHTHMYSHTLSLPYLHAIVYSHTLCHTHTLSPSSTSYSSSPVCWTTRGVLR